AAPFGALVLRLAIIAKSLKSLGTTLFCGDTKHRHLRRWAQHLVFRTHANKAHAITESRCNATSPILKLLPRPLEAMIGMAETTSPECFPLHVVLPVRRGQHNGSRLGELEQHALEGRQPRRIEMLDEFDHGGGIETLQPLVAVGERAMEKLQSRAKTRRCNDRTALRLRGLARDVFDPQPPSSNFQAPNRHIEPYDLFKLLLLHKLAQELALAAAQVEDALGAAGPQRGQHGPVPLLV